MRKWLVLAVGALLALSGLLFIWQGSDIIQIERGWASVISGAVALAGGVVTMAIGALIGTVERLQASLSQAGGVEVPAPSEPTTSPAPAPIPVPAPAPEPVHQPEPEPVPAPKPEPLPEPEEPKMPAAPALPPLAATFTAPEPPAPVPAPTPVPAPPAAAPVVAAAATAAVGAGLFGLFSRRRKAPEPLRDEPGDEQDAPRLPDFLVRRDVVGDAPKVELQEPAPEEASAAPDVTPQEPAGEETSPSPSADSYAWLDRALAGDDKPEPAFDWLRKSAPEPEKEPILEEEAAEPEAEEPFEQAYLAEEPEPESEPETEEPAPEDLPPPPPPTVVGRYSSGGADYTLYSDGSIDAQTLEGHQHFASMVELRAHIEAQKKD